MPYIKFKFCLIYPTFLGFSGTEWCRPQTIPFPSSPKILSINYELLIIILNNNCTFSGLTMSVRFRAAYPSMSESVSEYKNQPMN